MPPLIRALVHHPIVHATLLASLLYTLYQLSQPETVVSWPALAVLVLTWAFVSYGIARFMRQAGPGTALLAGSAAWLAGAFTVTFFKTAMAIPALPQLLGAAALNGLFTLLAAQLLREAKRLL